MCFKTALYATLLKLVIRAVNGGDASRLYCVYCSWPRNWRDGVATFIFIEDNPVVSYHVTILHTLMAWLVSPAATKASFLINSYCAGTMMRLICLLRPTPSATHSLLRRNDILKKILVKNVARTFYNTFVSRFGSPRHLTTDRGRQYISCLLQSLSRLTGKRRKYRNDIVRLPRKWNGGTSLQAIISSYQMSPTWHMDRYLIYIADAHTSSLEGDLQTTPDELMYGESILAQRMFVTVVNRDLKPWLRFAGITVILPNNGDQQ